MKKILILLASLFLLSSSAWPAGTLKVTTPNGGEKWVKGKSYAIKWDKGVRGNTVQIRLLKSGKHYMWISGNPPYTSTTQMMADLHGRYPHLWLLVVITKSGSLITVATILTKVTETSRLQNPQAAVAATRYARQVARK